MPSLQGGEINDFANRLFNRWGIGQKGRNNGVLLLVAVQDRKMRIEVGYGLEPVLPDILAARIIDEELRPRFRQNQLAEGLKRGVERIAAIVERGEAPSRFEMLKAKVFRPSAKPLSEQLGMLLFISLFVGLGCFIGGAGIGARQFFLPVWAAVFAGIPLVVAWNSGGLVFPVLVVVGIVAFIVGIVMGIRNPRMFHGTTTHGSGGGWSSGGFPAVTVAEDSGAVPPAAEARAAVPRAFHRGLARFTAEHGLLRGRGGREGRPEG